MLAYQVAMIEQLTDGLSKVFNGSYPDSLLQAPYVGPDYPLSRERFPSILVSFMPTKTTNLGMGHYATIVDDQTGATVTVPQWRFEGNVTFKVVAMTTLDRASISDQIIGVLAFGKNDDRFKPFWTAVLDNDFIDMALLVGSVTPGGDAQEATPWGDTDNFLYTTTLSVPCVGEFFGETFDSGLVRISQVSLLPYRFDQTPPEGTGDPNPWQ